MHGPKACLSVFALTHLMEARDKYSWIRASEYHERICLNKYKCRKIFGQVHEKN